MNSCTNCIHKPFCALSSTGAVCSSFKDKEKYVEREEIAREIFDQILNALKYTRFASPIEKSGTLNYIYSLAKKYTGGK